VDQLRQINTLCGSLILDRNAISLRLEQLQNLLLLLHERMDDLQEFNRELRRWYDHTSVNQPTLANNNTVNNFSENTSDFDSLELDQYSGLHLLAQEQMETIAKLQEVTADLDLTAQEMQQASHNLNYNSRNLQSRITRTQMRPLSEVVGRLPRVMRDLSVKYNKQVDLKIEGEHTLFERFALDVLADPINHLLRNAFDHGIESAEERERQGKSPNGTITIQAAQRGNNAILKVIDDGKGISTEKIKQRLRKHGIRDSQINELSEMELLEFIFDAGFSTAEQVTELSGRGVGMDVVRANLRQIQGDVQVTTIAGQGTTFTITLPLTSSIFRIMLLEANGFLFATPMDTIKNIQPIQSIPQRIEGGRSVLQWQNHTLTIHQPEDYWQFPRQTRLVEMTGKPIINQPLVVIFGEGEQHYALQVSRYWSEQEVAIRPITSPIPLPIGFSGVTTLGDGRIVPLVDPMVIGNVLAATIAQPKAPDALSSSKVLDSSNVLNSNNIASVTTVHEAQRTILIVDDSAHARRYLAISLENAGYRVEQAKDGQEAVERLVAGLSVDGIICDMEMPRLDGYGVLNELQTNPELRHLPIAMLTSRSSDKHRKLATQLGAKAYFSKPYNEQELLQTLSALIEKSLTPV
jgi:chemosensory pili system protein ChpA (sensor histidine kinase/response regulator)